MGFKLFFLYCSRMAFHIVFLCMCMVMVSSIINITKAQPASSVSIMDFGAVGDGKTDDTQAFAEAWEAICGGTANSSALLIPSGKTFLFQAMQFQGPCKFPSITIQILGNFVAPTRENWKSDKTGAWIDFSNVNNLNLDGSGQIDGQGSGWWNCSQGRPCENRHATFGFTKCNNLQLSGIKSINSQNNHISIIGCKVSTISGVQLIAPKDSPNTDGIDISLSSTYIQIQNSTIQTGDDCIAITSGCSFINITSINCGPGHGISIGSLGKDGGRGTVEEVHVKNCTFNATQNGARIKTWPGGRGFVRRITFEDITLIAVDHPVVIDQFYCPSTTCGDQPSAVNVSNVSFTGVHGTSMAKYAIRFNCSRNVPCTDIVVDHINITASKPDLSLQTFCNNAYGRSSNTIPLVNCLLPSSISMVVQDDTDNLPPSSTSTVVEDDTSEGHDEL